MKPEAATGGALRPYNLHDGNSMRYAMRCRLQSID